MSTSEKSTEIAVQKVIGVLSDRLKQEMAAGTGESIERIIRKYQGIVSRRSWHAAQKWCKWTQEGPVLSPDYARIYYRKGKTEIMVMEYPPRTRVMKFRGSLAKRSSSTEEISLDIKSKVFDYMLALPYVIFLLKFTDGMFTTGFCTFSPKPLKSLQEEIYKPYLSNLDSTLRICHGTNFHTQKLQKDKLTQQTAYILDHFWQTVYTDEWSHHFWDNKRHFSNDKRLCTLDAWQQASINDPLFVIDDVNWLRLGEDRYGDMIVKLIDSDPSDAGLRQDLYEDAARDLTKEIETAVSASVDTLIQKLMTVGSPEATSLHKDVMEVIKQSDAASVAS